MQLHVAFQELDTTGRLLNWNSPKRGSLAGARKKIPQMRVYLGFRGLGFRVCENVDKALLASSKELKTDTASTPTPVILIP